MKFSHIVQKMNKIMLKVKNIYYDVIFL